MKHLPDSVKRLIELKTFANLATIMPDGSPQVTQTWVDHENDQVSVNTFDGSQKSGNVRRNPNVPVTVTYPSDPFSDATLRGQVREITFNGTEIHVDRLAKKHLWMDTYPSRISGRKRILIKIEATSIISPQSDTRPRQGQTRQ